MPSETFPAAVVRELREKASRYRMRARDLERALIVRAIQSEAAVRGVVLGQISEAALARVTVDAECRVHGAAAAALSLAP